MQLNTSDQTLNDKILAAHDEADSSSLAKLYLEAAELKRVHDELAAVPFLLTQAYVFALECGDPLATQLHQQLVALGCEA